MTLIEGLDVKLAALLGTTYDNIAVNDMVVHQSAHQIFLSVERGRGPDVIPAIVKVNHGKLELLKLDSVPHSKVSVPDLPGETARLEFEPQSVYAITDVKYYNGEVFVTGISNHRFASTLYRIPYPFTAQKTTTVEIMGPGAWRVRDACADHSSANSRRRRRAAPVWGVRLHAACPLSTRRPERRCACARRCDRRTRLRQQPGRHAYL